MKPTGASSRSAAEDTRGGVHAGGVLCRGISLPQGTEHRSAGGTTGHTVPGTRAVAATVAVTALEFYDFVVYAFFAVQIGKAYFPSSTPLGSLLLSVSAFGVGFVTRPLGSILLGAYADRSGRRAAMLLSVFLMGVGTLGLALTPSYESIGLAAPLVVVVCRLLQGFALGGEVGPSLAYLVEVAPPRSRGLYSSWQLASQGIAACLAGLAGVSLTLLLTVDQLESWGWRVPLMLGLSVLPVAFYLRRDMPETLCAQKIESNGGAGLNGLRGQGRMLVLVVFIVMGATVSTYVGTFMTSYAITALNLPAPAALGATLVAGLCTLTFALFGGWLSDRVGRKAVMFWPRAAAALLTVPAFLVLIEQPTPAMLATVTGGLAALTAISGASTFAAIGELLPRDVRATGSAIAYAIGVSIFGGTTQVIVTWLVDATGNPAAPAWYVAGTSAIAALAILALPIPGQCGRV